MREGLPNRRYATAGPSPIQPRRGFIEEQQRRIERRSERPWLITPDQPDAFVRALSTHG